MNERLESVENLRAAMSERGITTGPTARIIGCSVRQVQRWLKGEAVPSKVYAALIDKAVRKLSRRNK